MGDAMTPLEQTMLQALKMACLVMAKGEGLSYADRREAHEACIDAIKLAETHWLTELVLYNLEEDKQ
jgi:hypothetical protein